LTSVQFTANISVPELTPGWFRKLKKEDKGEKQKDENNIKRGTKM
jgi:hypothetical protein